MDEINGVRESAAGGKVISGIVLQPVGRAYKEFLIKEIATCDSEEDKMKILLDEWDEHHRRMCQIMGVALSENLNDIWKFQAYDFDPIFD